MSSAPWPWGHLGLEQGASEREVRKAYATRLKAMKNSLVAQDFQSLREAYERALVLAPKDGERTFAHASAPSGQPLAGIRRSFEKQSAFGGPAHAPETSWRPPEAVEPSGDAGTVARDDPALRFSWRKLAFQERVPSRPPVCSAPDSNLNDRERIASTLGRIEDALTNDNEVMARQRFVAGLHDLEDPVAGVSLAAMAEFERLIARQLLKHRTRGLEADALFHDVARHFAWAERAQDVLTRPDSSDPLIIDCGLADAIWRSAGDPTEPSALVWREFAQDLVGPIRPFLFGRRMSTRSSLDRRQRKWLEIETLHSGVFHWLPARNVAWWHSALHGARMSWRPACMAHGWFVALVVAPLLALLGIPLFPAFLWLAGWVVIAAPALLLLVAIMQDHPVLKPVRKAAERWTPYRRWLGQTLPWGGVSDLTVSGLLLPLRIATMLVGIIGLMRNDKPPPISLADLLEMLAVAWTLATVGVVLFLAWRIVRHQVRKRGGLPFPHIAHPQRWVRWGVVALVGLGALNVGMVASPNQTLSLPNLALILAALGGTYAAGVGGLRLLRRLPSRWKAAGAFALITAYVLLFAVGLAAINGQDIATAIGGVGYVASVFAAVAGVALLSLKGWYWLVSRSKDALVWLDTVALSRAAPTLYARGIRLKHLLIALLVLAGAALYGWLRYG